MIIKYLCKVKNRALAWCAKFYVDYMHVNSSEMDYNRSYSESGVLKMKGHIFSLQYSYAWPIILLCSLLCAVS